MYGTLQADLQQTLQEIKDAGLYKKERVITSPQGAQIDTQEAGDVLNFCANNYLGLSSHPAVIEAAKATIDSHGYGMSSVRFICGTQDIHKQLEAKLAEFLGTEDTILYAAAFDANGGVFEPLFDERDAIISDALRGGRGGACPRPAAGVLSTVSIQVHIVRPAGGGKPRPYSL